MNYKASIIATVSIIFILFVIVVLYIRNSSSSVQYFGLGPSDLSPAQTKSDIVVNSDILNSDTVDFIQRKITGGGINPGWVISLLETQPNIFTGRVIVDDGVYQHPVVVKEEVTNIFVGNMKNVNGRTDLFSMKKIDKACTDSEGNTYEYSLSGNYGATQFSGCGGNLLKEAKSN